LVGAVALFSVAAASVVAQDREVDVLGSSVLVLVVAARVVVIATTITVVPAATGDVALDGKTTTSLREPVSRL
jgi:hypothetical protein